MSDEMERDYPRTGKIEMAFLGLIVTALVAGATAFISGVYTDEFKLILVGAGAIIFAAVLSVVWGMAAASARQSSQGDHWAGGDD